MCPRCQKPVYDHHGPSADQLLPMRFAGRVEACLPELWSPGALLGDWPKLRMHPKALHVRETPVLSHPWIEALHRFFMAKPLVFD